MLNTREKGVLEIKDLYKCDYVYAEKMCDDMYTLVRISLDLYKKELISKSGK